MPIRFSTQAANADKIAPDGADPAHPLPKDRGSAPGESEAADAGARGEGKPGKDINAAGFLKDRETPKP